VPACDARVGGVTVEEVAVGGVAVGGVEFIPNVAHATASLAFVNVAAIVDGGGADVAPSVWVPISREGGAEGSAAAVIPAR
jgi:hypothetical protein